MQAFDPLALPAYQVSTPDSNPEGILVASTAWAGKPVKSSQRLMLPVSFHLGMLRRLHGVAPDDASLDGSIIRYREPASYWGKPLTPVRLPNAVILGGNTGRDVYPLVLAGLGPAFLDDNKIFLGAKQDTEGDDSFLLADQPFLGNAGPATDPATGVVYQRRFFGVKSFSGGKTLVLTDEGPSAYIAITGTFPTFVAQEVADLVSWDIAALSGVVGRYRSLRARWFRWNDYSSEIDNGSYDSLLALIGSQAQADGIDGASGGPYPSSAGLFARASRYIDEIRSFFA